LALAALGFPSGNALVNPLWATGKGGKLAGLKVAYFSWLPWSKLLLKRWDFPHVDRKAWLDPLGGRRREGDGAQGQGQRQGFLLAEGLDLSAGPEESTQTRASLLSLDHIR
jgi:hypothetical protein